MSRKNSNKMVLIYSILLAIEAEKGNKNESNWPGEKFRHDFSRRTKAQVYGLPNGDLLIRGTKPLWRMCRYKDTGK